MSFFTSKRERRLWIVSAVMVTTIYATIGLAQAFFELLGNQNVNAILFVLSALLILAAVVTQGIKKRPSGTEIMIALGIIAIYVLVFVRLTAGTERSHLMEYSVVAIFILEALKERKSQGRKVKYPALFAIGITILIGIIDEAIQYFVPGRVMDPLDMVFNTMAPVMAVGASSILSWARRRYGGRNNSKTR